MKYLICILCWFGGCSAVVPEPFPEFDMEDSESAFDDSEFPSLDADSDVDGDSDGDTDSDTGSDSSSSSGSDGDTDSDSDADSDSDDDSDEESDPADETDSEEDSETESETEDDEDSDSVEQEDTETETGSETDEDTEPEVECSPDGKAYKGHCWHFSPKLDQNCGELCKFYGGYDDATLTIAGSAGNSADCDKILTLLNVFVQGTTLPLAAEDVDGIGCAYSESFGRVWTYGYETVSWAHHPIFQRVCACVE